MRQVIALGGGNTKNLLILWNEWGLDTILKKALEQGIILVGIYLGDN